MLPASPCRPSSSRWWRAAWRRHTRWLLPCGPRACPRWTFPCQLACSLLWTMGQSFIRYMQQGDRCVCLCTEWAVPHCCAQGQPACCCAFCTSTACPVLYEKRNLPSALQVFHSQKASVRDLQPWLTQGQDSGAAAPAVLNFDSLHSLPAAVQLEASTKGAQCSPCTPSPGLFVCGCLLRL